MEKTNRKSFVVREFFTMVRYGLVGLMNTGVFSLAAWLLHKTGWHYAAYTALAYAIAIVFSFTMNSIFTFRKKAAVGAGNQTGAESAAAPDDQPAAETEAGTKTGPMFIRFLIVTVSLLGAVQIIQLLLIEKLGWPELAGVISGMVFYTGVGYVFNRLWVFKGRS